MTPDLAGQAAVIRSPVRDNEMGGVPWFGVSELRMATRPHDPMRVIGHAHGPRLLELLRAS